MNSTTDPQAHSRLRIGDRLVAKGLITTDQLRLGLAEQKRTSDPIGKVLQALGFVTEEELSILLAEDLGVPFVRLHDEQIDRELLLRFDPDFLNASGAIPLREEKGIITVAMSRPSDVTVLDALQRAMHRPIRVVATTHADIRLALRRRGSTTHEPPLMTDEGNVVRQVERLLGRAIREGGTDIHIEPDERLCRIRFRVDGMMRAVDSVSVETGAAIISRIKVLAGLDIAEHRRPQDGRFEHASGGCHIDLRTSSLPTRFGENIVLRILDRSSGIPRLDRLEMADEVVAELRRIADSPHGLFLVTGPTGSGKTTTLYSLLCSIDSLSRKICSIEDPIESDLPLVRQSQVDPSAGFDFASGLRALLRQDPDVILVGEIRDRETAEIAMRASLTGHFVLATLHTNDAVSAPSRLLDMGIPPYLLNSSLCGVLAQRLVRRVCRDCAEPAAPDAVDRIVLADRLPDTVTHARGCAECGHSGYRGRRGIFELLVPDEAVRAVVASGCSRDSIVEVVARQGFQSMIQDGARRVLEGDTTSAEVLRVVGTGME